MYQTGNCQSLVSSPGVKHVERGSVMIFTALLLPIIIGLLILTSLALPHYIAERDAIQRELDSIGLVAVESLPDTEKAYEVAKTLTVFSERVRGGVKITANPDELSISFSGNIPTLMFGADISLPVSLTSVSTRLPKSVSLILDLTQDTAPAIGAQPWGDYFTWPASRYLSRYVPENEGPLSARFLTQQCFNPLLNPLKDAASQLAALVASLPRQPLAIALLGGGLPDPLKTSSALPYNTFTLARPLTSSATRRSQFHLKSEADLTFPISATATEEVCATLAEFDGTEVNFQLPVVPWLGTTSPTIDRASWRFFPDAQERLTVGQAIWFQPARALRVHNGSALLSDLVSLHLKDPALARRNSNARHEAVLLLAGDKGELLDSLITAAANMPGDLFSGEAYLNISSVLLQASISNRNAPDIGAEQLSTLQRKISALNASKTHIRVDLLVADSPLALSTKIVPALSRHISPVVLAR